MDGILIINKSQGMTSHDVVDFVRKKFGLKKVGHAGTLDPMATGVLVLLIGKYTKSAERFINDNKEYQAEMRLGATSDTGDAWGKIIPSSGSSSFSDNEIKETFNAFSGSIEQTPPMYSAVKYKGRKLYELARKGVSVAVKPRKIFIERLEILKLALPEIAFIITCSKGTYVRQICVDIGSRLGCGGYLTKLTRTRSGSFTIKEALDMDELFKIEKPELALRLRLL